MRKPVLAALALAVLAAPVPAAARRVAIVTPKRAAQSQGNLVAVRGRIHVEEDTVHMGKDIILRDDKGRIAFIGFIPRLNEYAFPQLSGMDGNVVVMYGVIEIYRGVPATQLIYSDQLRAG